MPVAEERAQKLDAQIAPDLWVVGDRDLLTQMFANLIDNAVVHSAAGADLSVQEVSAARGMIQVMVRDSGPGIPPQYRQAVLQRFYRLDRSRSTTGSGLGLSLVSAVASLHNATLVLADNEPGLRCLLLFPIRH